MPATMFFGASLGQWNGADAADAAGRIRLGTQADRDGLDLFTVADHPYFGDKLDAYALTAFLLGRTERITGMVTVDQPAQPSRAGTGAHAHLTVRAVRRAGHLGHRGRGDLGHDHQARRAPARRRGRGARHGRGDHAGPRAVRRGRPGHLRRRVLPRGWPRPGRRARSPGVHRLGRPEVPGRDRTAGRRLGPAGRFGLAERALPRVAPPRRRRRVRSRTGPGGHRRRVQLRRPHHPRTRSPPPAGRTAAGSAVPSSSGSTSSPPPSWTTTRPASSTATRTTPPPTRPWPAGPPRSSPPSAPPSPDSPVRSALSHRLPEPGR